MSSKATAKFYMVFLEGGNAPRFQHLTELQADDEAQRLAREFKRRAYVLQPVTSYEPPKEPDLIRVEYEPNTLPF